MSGKKKEPFKFSQFDEEFIIRKLWGNRPPGRCADIGARSRRGSNVAALLDKGWFCQLIDRDPNGLLKDFPVTPKSNHQIIGATVTPANINVLLARNLDLLSIDVDGNDYYLWQAVNQTPEIVVIETNPKMPTGVQGLNDRKIKSYFGCSIPKMIELGESKGYSLHCKTGVNLVFVREAELRPAA